MPDCIDLAAVNHTVCYVSKERYSKYLVKNQFFYFKMEQIADSK